ncbi:hypothetical protein ACWPMX_07735 [Tsuneonella sp. HG094]
MADLTVNINGSPTPIYLGESTALASAKAAIATSAAADALASKEVSQAAALSLANVFQTTAAGLAAVGPNETFWVFSGGLLSLYRDVAGVAVLLDSLPLSTAVLAKRAFGSTAMQSVDTELAGSDVPADIGPIYIGHNTQSADGITIDTAANFPPGVAFRRALGTLAAPTVVTSNTQLGYLDFRGYNSGKLWNVGSLDVLVNGAIAFGTDQPPRTFMRFAVCSNDNQANEAMRVQSYGDSDGVVKGAGLWSGFIEAGDPDNVSYLPRNGAQPRIYAVTGVQDWAAVFDSRFETAQALGVRIDMSRGNNEDYALAFALDGTIRASVRGDGMAVFPRARLGIETDPLFGSPTLAIANTLNDWAFTAESRPATGAGYAARFHTLGESSGDYIFGGSSGAGAGTFKFSVKGNGDVDTVTAYKVAGTQVVGARQAFIPDPAGGATVDTEGRAATSAILDLLAAHGLMAAS